MEAADIDWKKIESRYIKDDTYEHINAPKWLDLSAPDSYEHVDDEAWFCRPDCRHPKTHQDFLNLSPSSPKPYQSRTTTTTHTHSSDYSNRSSPQKKIMPLGERKLARDANANTLKRRGAIASLLLSSSSPVPKSNQGNGNRLREDDLENQDPNLCKVVKEAIKSSADKRGVVVNEEEVEKPVPKLKSTLSARNLFSGRDILGQISEFCNEIKKLAVGREKNPAAKEVAKEAQDEERKTLVDANSKDDEKLSVLKEVRACPPTPQRFPSPSSRRLRNAKAVTTSSPMNKPPKSVASERGILQDLNQSRKEKRALVAKDDDSNRASSAPETESEGSSSMDMFWFFKPCTYLVK